jgi:chitinase
MIHKPTQMKRVFTLIVLQFSIVCAFAQFRVVGYLPTWRGYPNSVNTVGLDKLTHLFVAFANPDANGNMLMGAGNSTDLAVVVNSAHAKNVKVQVSIGGGGTVPGPVYKNQIDNNLSNFTDNIVNFVVNNNLDGIDVDIEGNILDGTTLTSVEYENFILMLGTKMHAKNKIMSAAVASWFAGYITNTAAAKFDFIGMMSYDAYGPWGGPGQHSPYSMAVNDFNFWTQTKGVPAAKLNVGLPFYGYCWGTYASANGTSITYNDLVNKYAGAENTDQVGSGADVIYYNGISTIKQKTTFALQNAGGVMIWELTQDATDARSLLLAVDQTIKAAKMPMLPQFDYETITLPFNGFSGSTFSIVANPFKAGINTSAHVGMSNKGNQTYSGIQSVQLSSKIDFSTNKIFKLKVYSPVIGKMLMKLEDYTDGTKFIEVQTSNTLINQWEELSFDFSAATSMTYDKIVLFFNFGTTAQNDFYFDDLKMVKPLVTGMADFLSSDNLKLYPNPVQIDLYIELPYGNLQNVEVYDCTGKLVASDKTMASNGILNLEHLTPGIYMLRIFGENRCDFRKIVKG